MYFRLTLALFLIESFIFNHNESGKFSSLYFFYFILYPLRMKKLFWGDTDLIYLVVTRMKTDIS